MLSSTTSHVGFNKNYVDFINPTTTFKPKTQRKTRTQPEMQPAGDDIICGASTTTIEIENKDPFLCSYLLVAWCANITIYSFETKYIIAS
jgi:hypothetical protein